ncbi:hypothetical protein PFISCL1PPCAC_7365, partial [Pristionchus fissidentatus]
STRLRVYLEFLIRNFSFFSFLDFLIFENVRMDMCALKVWDSTCAQRRYSVTTSDVHRWMGTICSGRYPPIFPLHTSPQHESSLDSGLIESSVTSTSITMPHYHTSTISITPSFNERRVFALLFLSGQQFDHLKTFVFGGKNYMNIWELTKEKKFSVYLFIK